MEDRRPRPGRRRRPRVGRRSPLADLQVGAAVRRRERSSARPWTRGRPPDQVALDQKNPFDGKAKIDTARPAQRGDHGGEGDHQGRPRRSSSTSRPTPRAPPAATTACSAVSPSRRTASRSSSNLGQGGVLRIDAPRSKKDAAKPNAAQGQRSSQGSSARAIWPSGHRTASPLYSAERVRREGPNGRKASESDVKHEAQDRESMPSGRSRRRARWPSPQISMRPAFADDAPKDAPWRPRACPPRPWTARRRMPQPVRGLPAERQPEHRPRPAVLRRPVDPARRHHPRRDRRGQSRSPTRARRSSTRPYCLPRRRRRDRADGRVRRQDREGAGDGQGRRRPTGRSASGST